MTFLKANYTESLDFFGLSSPADLVEKYGSPLYVYNERILKKRLSELLSISDREGFGVNYSVKANSNPALLRIIRDAGATVDAMSPGELAMDKLAGYTPGDILYISNNNSAEEMKIAIDEGCLVSVDSIDQLELFGSLAPKARVMARINPGLGDGHNAKVITGGDASKFGISIRELPTLLKTCAKYELELVGLNQHIGSLFMKPDIYLEAAAVLLQIAAKLPSPIFHKIEILDFGGGFGIPYHKYEKEERLDLEAFSAAFNDLIENWALSANYGGQFLIEPGRYVVAECGILLGQVTATKSTGANRFVGTDLGFNVLMRPMLYDSWHDIEVYSPERPSSKIRQTIVGNICESGDILAKDRLLPELKRGDLIGVLDAGAYGFSMASNYNMRYLPAEVLIRETGESELIRRRQTNADLEACLANLQ